ncbi:MAG: hypothetical protein JXR25_04135, partial [Pontiellaceae bacterium]|nr:hypothetical protein [Pontiellaceae bacterium]
QWSIPPNEVVDFVAPGYYGWRSGESEGPYWGRTGQSAEWEKTGQGFRNFKLESTYIGMIPFAFAFFALFAFRRSEHMAEILFCAGAALIALLLSFGKYFPLYALFYKLPVVNSIRNPNKFIQVFQVCLAILSAYGMDAMWRSRDEDRSETGTRRPLFIFFMSSVAVTLIFCLWALIDMLAMKHGVAALIAGGWQATAAKSIAQTRVAALGHAALMAFISTGITALFCFRLFEKAKSFGAVTAAVILLIVAGDAVQLSKKYIKKMPRSYIASNALTDFLDKNLSGRRVAFLSQQGIDNIWITYLMPYNRIPCFNFTDMPRIANDYKAFLEIGQRNPLNMWRLSSVKYLLGPATLEEQLSEAGCRKVFAYGLSDAGQGEFKVVPHANGPFAVYELQGSLPRYALFAGSRKFPEAQLLPATLSNLNEVCLPEASSLPVLSGSGATGSIEVLSSRAGKVRLKVNANAPAILRASEKYDPDWTASLDGENVAVEPVDFLFQGIFIPTGEHEVVLRYAPSRFYFCLQCIGMLLMVGAVVWVVVRRKGVHVAD